LYYGFMPPPVRVIGRIDLAEKVHEVLRAAGFDAEVVTAGPTFVFGEGTPPAEGVDVVVATSFSDPILWRVAKGRHPSRPMVAVGERRREGALRGAMLRRNGPDAYATWPATPDHLGAAIRRAESSASRQRSWGAADLRAALVLAGLILARATGGVGAVVAGVCLLLGVPYAWSRRWQVVGGVLLTVFGVVGVAAHLLDWAR
jgi:hypothetical protein